MFLFQLQTRKGAVLINAGSIGVPLKNLSR
jgi:hypothetical protein